MQVFVSNELEKSINTHSMYSYSNVENNRIGTEGCRFLSQARWNNLKADLRIIHNI